MRKIRLISNSNKIKRIGLNLVMRLSAFTALKAEKIKRLAVNNSATLEYCPSWLIFAP